MSERINIHIPMFSVNSRAVIGDAREDRRNTTAYRTGHGGQIHPGGAGENNDSDAGRGRSMASGTARTVQSVGSTKSVGSVLSFLSIGSLGSFASILSVGSAGSVLSIGSAGSILSIGSAGSILSIGSAGSVLSIGSAGARGTGDGRDEAISRLVGPAATTLAVSALLTAIAGMRR